jgi:hypothetical protein
VLKVPAPALIIDANGRSRPIDNERLFAQLVEEFHSTVQEVEKTLAFEQDGSGSVSIQTQDDVSEAMMPTAGRETSEPPSLPAAHSIRFVPPKPVVYLGEVGLDSTTILYPRRRIWCCANSAPVPYIVSEDMM